MRFGRSGRKLLPEFLPFRLAFGDGHVSGGIGKRFELTVGYFGFVHTKPVNANEVCGTFVLVGRRVVATHCELSPGNPYHAFRRFTRRWFRSMAILISRGSLYT